MTNGNDKDGAGLVPDFAQEPGVSDSVTPELAQRRSGQGFSTLPGIVKRFKTGSQVRPDPGRAGVAQSPDVICRLSVTSILQVKDRVQLVEGQSAPATLAMRDQCRLGVAEILNGLEMVLNRLPDVERRGPPGPRRESLQTGMGFI